MAVLTSDKVALIMTILKHIVGAVAAQALCFLVLLAITFLPPKVQATVCSRDQCPPCAKMEKEIRAELVPLGWTLATDKEGDKEAAHIVITKRHYERLTPTTIITANGKEVWRKVGYISADELSKALNKARK